MIDLGLDNLTHDIILDNNDMILFDGAERVKQHLKIKLKLWQGEWFLDTAFGTPYLTDILGKQITLSGAIAALKKSILEVEGVKAITRFDFDFNRSQRVLTVDFDVDSLYGKVSYYGA